MNNAELIEALRTDIREIEDDSVNTLRLMWQAADLIEAQQKALDECAKQLADMAAKVPKEGEWIGRQKHRRCSICGFSTWYDFALDCELTSPFCPECGARMKGEQE